MEQEEIIIQEQKPKQTSKILAWIAFGLSIFSIILAGVFDFLAFKEAIMSLIGAIFATAVVFIVLIMAFLVSLVLIFGIIILQDKGFWPLKAMETVFKEIMGSVEFAPSQIATFKIYRIVLIALCVVIFVLSIIALVKHKLEQKKYPLEKSNSAKVLSIIALILSIFGILASAAAILIFAL